MNMDEALGNRTIALNYGPQLSIYTIDQTKLPREKVILELKTLQSVVEAIRTMRIRGAPLLGATAAFALALVAHNSNTKKRDTLLDKLRVAAEILRKTRPTAVNLFWGIDQIVTKAENHSGNVDELVNLIVQEAQTIADEDVAANRLMGKYGAELIRDGDVILTHCNAGALATVGYGTALGVIRAAWEEGKQIRVFATETRPKLQGARLTAYELKEEGIPVTLITDSMAGFVMHKRLVNKVIVGADRIVQDAVINKIGTFMIAVLAKEHNIPFYVAAPKSTFDLSRTSAEVLIEERPIKEVTQVDSRQIAAKGVQALNPAFDITALNYVTAIIYEQGILTKQDFAKFKANNYM